jgi:hypothetical protein
VGRRVPVRTRGVEFGVLEVVSASVLLYFWVGGPDTGGWLIRGFCQEDTDRGHNMYVVYLDAEENILINPFSCRESSSCACFTIIGQKNCIIEPSLTEEYQKDTVHLENIRPTSAIFHKPRLAEDLRRRRA